jgi:hypothetical protein
MRLLPDVILYFSQVSIMVRLHSLSVSPKSDVGKNLLFSTSKPIVLRIPITVYSIGITNYRRKIRQRRHSRNLPMSGDVESLTLPNPELFGQ